MARKDIPKFEPYIARLTTQEAAEIYAGLRQDVEAAGILDRSYYYYSVLAFLSISGFILSLVAVYYSDSWLLLFASCAVLTVFAIQIGGLIHDSGHRAIAATAKANDFLGYIFSAIILTVFDSWKSTHNAHHANPNQVDEDPDMVIPFIAYDREVYDRKTKLEKRVMKYQAYLYYPVLSMAGLSLRLGRFFWYKDFKPHMWWHLAIYVLSFSFWFIAPFFVFPFTKALFFVVATNVLMGIYMSNIFAPNHKGMPEFKKGSNPAFLEQQIITARNVNGGFFTDILLIGLNYQIEHHLFPNCPRNKLKMITPYVLAICKKYNLEYTSVSFVKSNKIILRELQAVAVAA